jgi:hypothetical protein
LHCGRKSFPRNRDRPGKLDLRNSIRFFDQVRKTPIPTAVWLRRKSTTLDDRSDNYTFGDARKKLPGSRGRKLQKYILDSDGTLFLIPWIAININEVGAYAK